MGGLAGTAGPRRLTAAAPHWLVGGDAALVIANDGATVWWLDIDSPAARARADRIAPLPGEAAGFARLPDAGRRLIRRKLARSLLAAAGGCAPGDVAVDRDGHGAPIVVAPDHWHLAVAGRWPFALIGVSRGKLGVDVEMVEDAAPALDLLTPAERRSIDGLPPDERRRVFARLWAAKEAHAKWSGVPRSIDPATVEVTGDGVASPWGRTRCWRRDIGPFAAAICMA